MKFHLSMAGAGGSATFSRGARLGRSRQSVAPRISNQTPLPRNPKPETPNPRPEILNQKLETRHQQPQSRNQKPEALESSPYTRDPKAVLKARRRTVIQNAVRFSSRVRICTERNVSWIWWFRTSIVSSRFLYFVSSFLRCQYHSTSSWSLFDESNRGGY